jgi:hypothetical protein
LQPATGEALDALVQSIGLARRRKVKRVWWALWLWRRDESDAELRARANEHLLKLWDHTPWWADPKRVSKAWDKGLWSKS